MSAVVLMPAEAGRLAASILDRVEEVVVGKRAVLELVLVGLLADGHILLEDVPGVAKTLIARSFAQAAGLGFGRVQCTPDLLPSDITGSTVLAADQRSLEFRPGPVFTHLLLADEVNRATPKTQAALLEAMQERQVTVDGTTRVLDRPFLVLATQNPIEYEGTYPLPEAQLDRFLLRLAVGYPSEDAEVAMLDRRIDRRTEQVELAPVADRATLVNLQDAVESVHVDPDVRRYVVDIVGATRRQNAFQVGASPRGSLGLLAAARALALVRGRDHALPDDVKAVAVPVLGHRVSLRPDLWVRGTRVERLITDCVAGVPAPVPGELRPR